MIGIHWRREKLIDYYLAGALSEKQRQSFESHLEQCASCRKLLDEIQSFDEKISLVDKYLRPPPEFRQALRDSIMSLPPYSVFVKSHAPVEREKKISVSWSGWRPAYTWSIVASLTTILAIISIVYLITPRLTPIKVAKTTGNGIFYKAPSGKTWNNIGAIKKLQPGGQLKTDDFSLASLTLGKNNQIWINHSTQVTLVSNSTTALDLSRGDIYVTVSHYGKVYRVKTPAGMVLVTGTEFHVTVSQNQQTLVTCLKDTVYFENSLGRVAIPEGYQSAATPQKPPEAPVPFATQPDYEWKSIIDQLKNLTSQEKNDLIVKYTELGNDLYDRQDYTEALRDYHLVVYIDPQYAGGFYSVGRAYRRLGDYNLSTTSYYRAVSLDPNNSRTIYQLCESLMELGKYPEAEKLLQHLVVIRKGSHADWIMLGNALLLQGKWDQAEYAFQQGSFYGANTCPYCIAYLQGGLATVERARKHYDMAEIELELPKQVENPVIPSLYYAEEAWIYQEEHKFELEQTAWENYLKIDPDGNFAEEAKKRLSALQSAH